MVYTFKKRIIDYFLLLMSGKKNDFFSRLLMFVLLVFSSFYRIIIYLSMLPYNTGIIRPYKAKIKVISVGNISAGGTGKTPVVEKVINLLIDLKHRPAVISRGYAGKKINSEITADEPEMLKKEFPRVRIIINKDRVSGIKQLQENESCDCAVLDDALQNTKICKDLEIICIDCTNPFGNGRLLPAGILRLPFSYLKKADIIVLTHSDLGNDNIGNVRKVLNKFNPHALVCRSRHEAEFFYNILNGEKKELGFMSGEKVMLLCGIANPLSLEMILKSLKIRVESKVILEDHHYYTFKELKDIFDSCVRLHIKRIITTAKDEPKIKAALGKEKADCEIWVLKINLKIEENEAKFNKQISDICSA